MMTPAAYLFWRQPSDRPRTISGSLPDAMAQEFLTLFHAQFSAQIIFHGMGTAFQGDMRKSPGRLNSPSTLEAGPATRCEFESVPGV